MVKIGELSRDAERLLRDARVARLATADASGRPHLVPVVFALREDRLYIPVDHKPKKSPGPGSLRRIRNLRENPRASLLVDHYEEAWGKLAWVRVDGPTEFLERGVAYGEAVEALTAKYAQYRAHPLPPEGRGLIILLRVETVRAWHA